MGYELVAMSDLHHHCAAQAIVGFIRERHAGLDELLLVGDRSIDPDFSATDGRNVLREMKKAAKKEALEAGLDPNEYYKHMEALFWRGEHPNYQDPAFLALVAHQWLAPLGPTLIMHKQFESAIASGILPGVIVDTDGNDYDKDDRVIGAYELLARLEGIERADTLLEIMARSSAFRTIQGVEHFGSGETLDLRVPYLENKTDEQIGGYVAAVHDVTKDVNGVRQVIFYGHLNPDGSLRKEKRNEAYLEMYEAARANLPRAQLLHVFGHSHFLAPKEHPDVFSGVPYEHNGVLLLPIGYGKEEVKARGLSLLQRVAVFDYANRRARRFADLDLKAEGALAHEKGF